MEAAGIAPPESCCAHGPHSRAEARRLASRVLSQPDRPTAVVAASDTQAIGVLEAARDVGLRVPDQLSVVGYDDVEIAEIANLTTVRLPLFRSGQRGAELLIEAVRGEMPQAGAREVLPVELVVRGTTAPPSTSASPVRSHRA
jgi:DNA-binding LacI/PurR family transcriptional regulator